MEVESKQLAEFREELSLLRRELDQQKIREAKLEAEFEAYRENEQKKETQRLRTALIGAGGIIIALGSFVWVEIIWPVIEVGRK